VAVKRRGVWQNTPLEPTPLPPAKALEPILTDEEAGRVVLPPLPAPTAHLDRLGRCDHDDRPAHHYLEAMGEKATRRPATEPDIDMVDFGCGCVVEARRSRYTRQWNETARPCARHRAALSL
jgi:hypothetical protein